MTRRDWLLFPAQLARTSPTLRADVWQMLGDAAATGLIEGEHARALPSHPLSPMRIAGDSEEEAAMHAAEILAWTGEWVTVRELDPLVAALERAAASLFPKVRAASARALGGRGTLDTPPAIRAALRTHVEARAALQFLSRDRDDAVRLAAYEAADTSLDPLESGRS